MFVIIVGFIYLIFNYQQRNSWLVFIFVCTVPYNNLDGINFQIQGYRSLRAFFRQDRQGVASHEGALFDNFRPVQSMHDRQLRASFESDIFSSLLKKVPQWKLAKAYSTDSNEKISQDQNQSSSDQKAAISGDGSFNSSLSAGNLPEEGSVVVSRMDRKGQQFPLHTVVE